MTWFLLDAPLIVAFLLFLMVLDKLLFSCFKLMAESEPEFFFSFLFCFYLFSDKAAQNRSQTKP